jgi:hypothetical protein
MSNTFVGDGKLRLLKSASGKPPFLSGERDGAVIRLSTAKREEVRLAQQELDRWQDAFDQNCQGDPDKYHNEIRLAERRLHSAISSATGRTEVVPALQITTG